ncbi:MULTISPECIES: FkbM family methyltransferase [Nostoc]|uniref:FkbM family methyltransferase n=1 Tax=Nostoc paludosum FACHB-159 TaxID=2692908 RepID=A0ABR8JYQ1_9NOSO|nr:MULTISPECIES: FkbM family methyltransferase [Nostoc]MBD2676358.1 FkbM family methyltransferase [Nostoc sp. FACHB-857]MBD2732514.1 FkbM family methyltransferase [Nostoc paludosum FACHB-159]
MYKTTKQNILDIVISTYRFFFLRKSLFKLNKLIFSLSLRGMGILNHENDRLSGEDFFIKKIAKILHNSVVIDVGANIGNYSNKIKTSSPSTNIYAFEPHPNTFTELEIQANQNHYVALNAACSDLAGSLQLYDYEKKTSHASLYKDVIDKIHKGVSQSWYVNVTTIDEFVKSSEIERIRLLKIDTEGNELKVLLGAKESLAEGLIDIIQLEFNEMNVISRVFFRDIYEILNNYLLYRLLPDGLVFLGEYYSLNLEIFAYQNIIAIRKEYINEVKDWLDI